MQMISRLNVLPSSMTKPKAKKRHAMLTEVIRRHDHAYYMLAEPTISDQDYDRLYRELLDLEEAHPGLLTADSPSQRVGGKPVSEFPEHRHAVPMMSLDNTYSYEEMSEFLKRVKSFCRKPIWTGRWSRRWMVWPLVYAMKMEYWQLVPRVVMV